MGLDGPTGGEGTEDEVTVEVVGGRLNFVNASFAGRTATWEETGDAIAWQRRQLQLTASKKIAIGVVKAMKQFRSVSAWR